MKKQQGFTLIELMIVVAIIGILAAIAIPQYQDYIARTQVNRAVGELSSLKTAVEESLMRGQYTGMAAPAVSMSGNTLGRVLSNLTAPGGVDSFAVNFAAAGSLTNIEAAAPGNGFMTATLGGQSSAAVTTAAIYLSRTSAGTWQCDIAVPAALTAWKTSFVPAGCNQVVAPYTP